MSREYEQFVKDCEFISKDKDNWVFQPLYEIARRLVLFYEKYYKKAE